MKVRERQEERDRVKRRKNDKLSPSGVEGEEIERDRRERQKER